MRLNSRTRMADPTMYSELHTPALGLRKVLALLAYVSQPRSSWYAVSTIWRIEDI